MTDVARQLRSSRCAPPSACAMVPHVFATILPTEPSEIAIGDYPCATWSPLQSNETAPRYRQPLAVTLVFATVLEATSPYRPRLRRCT